MAPADLSLVRALSIAKPISSIVSALPSPSSPLISFPRVDVDVPPYERHAVLALLDI